MREISRRERVEIVAPREKGARPSTGQPVPHAHEVGELTMRTAPFVILSSWRLPHMAYGTSAHVAHARRHDEISSLLRNYGSAAC